MNALMRRFIVAGLIACIALPLLASCGKKGRLESPPGEDQQYPRQYPSK